MPSDEEASVGTLRAKRFYGSASPGIYLRMTSVRLPDDEFMLVSDLTVSQHEVFQRL
jgi:hypothetical protein